MGNHSMTKFDLLIETHQGLKRQGPGSPEMTLRALSFISHLDEHSRIADLGCGTGGQTMLLAQNTAGFITGVDLISDFIDVFQDQVKELHLENRVTGMVGSAEGLPFEKDELDLIWSEGMIDGIGFEKGLTYWSRFLKKGGYVALTCPAWLTDEYPPAVKKFWEDAGSSLDAIGNHISIMQKIGYRLVAAFTLPDVCWTENYFLPRAEAEKNLLKKYAGNPIVSDYVKEDQYEADLYAKYHQSYGYVFYIGKKVS